VDVFLANEQTQPVDETRLTALASHVLGQEDIDDEAELSLLLVNSGHMRQLNARFAGNDYSTDVLAFPMMEDDEDEEEVVLGDVVLCPEVAARNAARLDHSVDTEIDVLLVHGMLHLLGYDHQSSQQRTRMDRRAREVLESFSKANHGS
jgi:probable rRNA maturation factor